MIALFAAAPAAAHDFWIQPETFQLNAPGSTALSIQVGHGPARQRSPVSLDRIVAFRSYGPGSPQDRRPELRGRPDSQDPRLSFNAPGLYMLALETNHAASELPGLRFTDYIKAEGLTPALKLREQMHATDAPGREIYSRRAKALIQVGPANAQAQAIAVRPLGMSLEIVPERSPYDPNGAEMLPVRVYFEGRPLPGALVKLNNLEFDARPVETRLTDAQGRASFRVPRVGAWQMNVIWTKALKNDPRADFDTTFSSLTFGFSGDRGRRR